VVCDYHEGAMDQERAIEYLLSRLEEND
jgi:hypothetical protein